MRRGFTTVIATDGEEGLRMVVSEKPDVVIMDMGLPVLDGWEATRRLKAAEVTIHAITGMRREDLGADRTAGARAP